jgi:hypothetical protein
MGEALETTTDKFVGAFARPRDLGRPFRADRFQSDFVIGENARPGLCRPAHFQAIAGIELDQRRVHREREYRSQRHMRSGDHPAGIFALSLGPVRVVG